MNEISTAIVIPDSGSIMSKVIELASAPGTNPEMFDRLVAWQEREQARQALIAFDDAMSAAQGEIEPVARKAWNDQTKSRHATLDGIDEAIRPIYTKHGFSVSFTEVANDNTDIKLACIVSRSGHSKTFYLPGAPDTLGPKGTPNKTQVQGVGSTVSYLRRYLICLAFNVATRDDNDGNRPRDTGEVIGRVEAGLLAQLISECAFDPTAVETNERGFLNSFGFSALASLKQIPAGEFPRLKTALLNKKQGQRARTGEAA
jgi:ERF superfamily protein